MTTMVHVVNIGNWPVKVERVNPKDPEDLGKPVKMLYPGESVNEYVYDTQNVVVSEVPPEKS